MRTIKFDTIHRGFMGPYNTWLGRQNDGLKSGGGGHWQSLRHVKACRYLWHLQAACQTQSVAACRCGAAGPTRLLNAAGLRAFFSSPPLSLFRNTETWTGRALPAQRQFKRCWWGKTARSSAEKVRVNSETRTCSLSTALFPWPLGLCKSWILHQNYLIIHSFIFCSAEDSASQFIIIHHYFLDKLSKRKT